MKAWQYCLQKWNSFNLTWTVDLPHPPFFRFNFDEKFKPLGFAKDLEFFLFFACISQNSLPNDDFLGNKICILLHLDIVDDVKVNT